MRPTQAWIDLNALQHNFQRVRQAAAKQRVIAVVKANAYGHGAKRVAKALEPLTDAFAVASIEEAVTLRDNGIQKPIMLLEGFFEPAEFAAIATYQLQPVLHCVEQIHTLETVRLAKPVDAWMKIDTGMHRLGLLPNQVQTCWQRLKANRNLKSIRLMSHFACADEPRNPATLQQLAVFETATRGFDAEVSLANSAAILQWQMTHADWVRPGIMLYGASPFADSSAQQQQLRPVMHLRSRLISIKQHQRNEAVGYGGTWRCPIDNTPIGIVACGYADGYPRHASSGTPVLVGQQQATLAGRVSMDMLAVDLTDCPKAKVGDTVTLWGEGLSADVIAQRAGTIAYELFCNVSSRVPRVVKE